MLEEHKDVLVIGAGPAGSVASTYLARKGYDVLVVEKMKFPRFVIGESLLPHCMDHLEEVGLLPYLKKRNYQHKEGVIFYKDKEVSIFNFSEQFTKGKTSTWQVPRADFDNTLINGAQDQGVNVFFECSVTDIKVKENHQEAIIEKTSGEKTVVFSKFLIDASGYGRVLPRLLNLTKDSNLPVRTALFTHIKDVNKKKFIKDINFITYNVFNDYYVWNIPFANNTISVGIVGENHNFESLNGSPKEKFEYFIKNTPYMSKRYSKENILLEPKLLKGFSVGVKKLYGNGYALTGNSTEFLDPVFSSGVTLATESGLLSAKLADKELQGLHVDWEKEYEEYIRFGIDVFKTYVNAWYDRTLHKIFFAKENHNQLFREQICSILAGYVWDKKNPCVLRYKKILSTISTVLDLQSNS